MGLVRRLQSIDGYKPRGNYQRSLLPAILSEALRERPGLRAAIERDAADEPGIPEIDDILSIFDPDPPASTPPYGRGRDLGSGPWIADAPGLSPFEIERRNRAVGLAGEQLVVRFERRRLIVAGRENLADRVEHMSVERGDGAGFDIRSFDERGRDLFIEVKTTRFRRETPFFISSNEVDFLNRHAKRYALYRVYRLARAPRLFALPGEVGRHVELTPTAFRARF